MFITGPPREILSHAGYLKRNMKLGWNVRSSQGLFWHEFYAIPMSIHVKNSNPPGSQENISLVIEGLCSHINIRKQNETKSDEHERTETINTSNKGEEELANGEKLCNK